MSSNKETKPNQTCIVSYYGNVHLLQVNFEKNKKNPQNSVNYQMLLKPSVFKQ